MGLIIEAELKNWSSCGAAAERDLGQCRLRRTPRLLDCHCSAHPPTMATEMPGAAYLQRRLARAQAVPPAERSPDVQAFITSVELGERICELLPLTRGGQAVLPLRDTHHRPQARVVWLPCIRLSSAAAG